MCGIFGQFSFGRGPVDPLIISAMSQSIRHRGPDATGHHADDTVVLGNRRLRTMPVWELTFGNLPDGTRPIATGKVKWDEDYQEKLEIHTGPAENLPEGVEDRIVRYCKKAYKALGMSGYARMDFRLTDDGRLYLLEPNPNPDLNKDEDFAYSAAAAGIQHPELIQRIINLGFRHREGK